MKVCFALLYYDPEAVADDPRDYLRAVRSAHDLPQAVAARGHEVSVVHLYPFDARLQQEGVDHHFVAPGPVARGLGSLLSRRRRRVAARFTPAGRAISRIQRQRADVVHFFGTSLHLNLALLVARRGAAEAPALVLHFHGGGPARSRIGRALQRYGFGGATRCLFTTREQADEHVAAGLLEPRGNAVVQLVETSSRFRPEPRAVARARTGIVGDPVFVWAARLHPLKDPMTALRGFARIAAARPEARLYVYYRQDDLLDEIRLEIAANEHLRGRVHLGGELPYEAMEAVLNSADFLLQASLREHSGCAVLDAMACGTIPVVTDIPSFRAMAGTAGMLFPPGDDAALARAVLDLAPDDIAARSAAVRERFASRLSFAALAAALESTYDEVVSKRAETAADALRDGAVT